MTATVEKRVVEMAFDNNQFENGVGKSLSTIDKLKKSLNFDGSSKSLSGLNDAAGKVNLGALTEGVQKVGSGFNAMSIVAITALVNITNAAINAGKKIVDALVIKPVALGFKEYEQGLTAFQTILANTKTAGATVDDVNKALQTLNEYANLTIFSFGDMTKAIGLFTAQGVNLDDSITAIKGIFNIVSLTGGSADKANGAIYQLSQAIASGTVRAQDWISVVNAGIGGTDFQTQLINTARSMGIAVDAAIEKQGSFKASLEENWLSSKVLLQTLKQYTVDLSDEQLKALGYTDDQIKQIKELGARATESATKMKSVTQLMDTLASNAVTSWAKTFKIVFGDLDEASAFWTTFGNFAGSILQSANDARNSLLQGWKDLGGRTKLIEAFQNVLNGIVAVINPIIQGFREFFPATTAQQLFALTEGLVKFTDNVRKALEGTDKVKRIFRGVFALFDIGKMAIVALVKQFGILVGSFSSTGAGLTELIAKFGDWLVKLHDAVKQSDIFTTVFTNIRNVIAPVLHGVISFFTALVSGFSHTNKAVKSSSLSNFLAELSEKFKSFGKLGIIISKVFDILSKVAEKFGPVFVAIGRKLGDLVNHLLDAVTRGLDKLDAGKIVDFFNKGLLSGVLLSLNGFINSSKKIVGGGLFATILLSIKDFIDNGGSVFKGVAGILDGVKNSLDSYQKTLKANTLLKIAGAVGLLALSIIALTLVDQTKLVNATAVIGAMFVGLTSTLDVFEKTTDGGKKILVMTASLIGISTSLLLLSGAVLILSKLDPKEAIQGVASVGAILGVLLLFQKFSSGSKGLAGATLGLIGLSIALLGLNVALRALGNMKTDVLEQGLLGMAAALGIISVAMTSMNTGFAGAGALLVAAVGITVLATALKLVGSLSLEQIGAGLLAIAGVLTILGVAGALLTPVAPIIAIVALSLAAIGAAALGVGVAIGAIGAGLGSLALGIVALAGLTSVGIGAITLVITGLAALIPMLAIQVVKGIAAFLIELYHQAPKVALALVGIGVELIKGFNKLVPQVTILVLDMLLKFLDAVSVRLPEITKKGNEVMIGFLKGIRDNMGDIVSVSVDIVKAYLTAITARLPEIIESGWKLMISFIDGMKTSVTEHLPELIDSTQELGWAIAEGVLKGLISNHARAKEGIKALGQILIDGFKENLGIHSPSDVFTALAGLIIDGLVLGLKNFAFKTLSQLKTMAENMVTTVRSKIGSMTTAGQDLVLGFANGIKNYISTAVKNAGDLAAAVLNKIANVLDSHSPSRKTEELGKFADQGLANGISKFAGLVTNATKGLGTSAITGFNSIISRVSDAMNTNMDFAPSIRPVLDLSDIQAGASGIDSLLANKSLNMSVATDKVSLISPKSVTAEQTAATPASQGVSNKIEFTQNNYSPKELSRIDIYRQTKNQLIQVKGLVGA